MNALKIKEDGTLEYATIDRIDRGGYVDSLGRELRDSGETQTLMGWGEMDGEAKIITDEYGDPAYYIHD